MSGLFLTLLGYSALAIMSLMGCLWVIALKIKDASIIDLVWGAGFAMVAVICVVVLSGRSLMTGYLWLLAALPCLWALRYSAYIWKRNIGHGEDPRYTAMRRGKSNRQWPLYLLCVVYGFQALAMLIVALPIIFGMAGGAAGATSVSALAIAGSVICLAGIAYEALADFQLARFKRRRAELGSKVTGKVMDQGLWRYSRHPNYFGNAVLWWGIFLVACIAPWGWLSIIGPVFMTYCLIRVSGADHLERQLRKRPEYADYMTRTSKFIPMPPKNDTALKV